MKTFEKNMIGYRYNPFSKPLAEFSPEELNVLRDVNEGWFVDYKSEPLSPQNFGKHLSAFANQFGGWLFIGVKEGPNKTLRAESFPGIPSSDVGSVLVRIREGISAHVSPSFYFDHRVIDGPLETIGLEAGRSIIVVGVPEGQNPPFVHSSGKIYRRIADSSEPKAETDRAVLDTMWRKSEDLRTRLRNFIIMPIESSPTENTYCHVYFLEDLMLSPHRYDLDIQGFTDAMQRDTPVGASMPLDNFYATQDGFIGRHVYSNNPLNDLIALRWWRNGNARLTIPINYLYVSPQEVVRDEKFRRFVSLMGEFGKLYKRVLDLDQWLFVVFALTHRYLGLRDMLGSKTPIHGKIVFSNAKTATPFIGMDSYLSAVKQYGIPVIQDSLIASPLGTEPDSFASLIDTPQNKDFKRVCDIVFPLVVSALRSLGIIVDPQNAEDVGLDFVTAMQRGSGSEFCNLG